MKVVTGIADFVLPEDGDAEKLTARNEEYIRVLLTLLPNAHTRRNSQCFESFVVR